ncbi:MAG TPA: hypothetical protein VMR21_03990 [Vicinamibacteria bacterium]|nr:hypothetical protein [Vicinamibacteria bacterium]
MDVALTPGRIKLARAIAMAADLLEIVVFPAFMEGFLSPVNDAVDVVVAITLISLLGWHWAFLPTFLSEMIPVWGLVPTWTAAVFYVTSGTPPPTDGAPSARVEPPAAPPALKP